MARSMKSALGSSLKAEEEAVKSRFEKAEHLLARSDFPEQLHTAETTNAHAAGNELPAMPLKNAPLDDGERVKRDSFTMPYADYDRIAQLQKRCLTLEIGATKSEILRAGLTALAALTDEELSALVEKLPKVKTGRRPLTNGHTV